MLRPSLDELRGAASARDGAFGAALEAAPETALARVTASRMGGG
jgi:hypothetical protein